MFIVYTSWKPLLMFLLCIGNHINNITQNNNMMFITSLQRLHHRLYWPDVHFMFTLQNILFKRKDYKISGLSEYN